jgi:hypothetical protein
MQENNLKKILFLKSNNRKQNQKKAATEKTDLQLEHELQQLPQKIQKTEDEIAACNALWQMPILRARCRRFPRGS